MAAVEKYLTIANNLSKGQIKTISDYYENWQGQTTIPLKFRFLKTFAKNLSTGEAKWYLVHKLVNKRRITNSMLSDIILSLIDQNIIPLRIFHSTIEWLSPHEVWNNPHHDPWILRSGIAPLENDENLETSIKTAQVLHKQLDKSCHFVYSGNKSVHVWYPFDLLEFYADKSAFRSAKTLENAERAARYEFFNKIQKKIDYQLDNRITADTRRVVPIIDSLNGLTGRRVRAIEPKQIEFITAQDLVEVTSIY